MIAIQQDSSLSGRTCWITTAGVVQRAIQDIDFSPDGARLYLVSDASWANRVSQGDGIYALDVSAIAPATAPITRLPDTALVVGESAALATSGLWGDDAIFVVGSGPRGWAMDNGPLDLSASTPTELKSRLGSIGGRTLAAFGPYGGYEFTTLDGLRDAYQDYPLSGGCIDTMSSDGFVSWQPVSAPLYVVLMSDLRRWAAACVPDAMPQGGDPQQVAMWPLGDIPASARTLVLVRAGLPARSPAHRDLVSNMVESGQVLVLTRTSAGAVQRVGTLAVEEEGGGGRPPTEITAALSDPSSSILVDHIGGVWVRQTALSAPRTAVTGTIDRERSVFLGPVASTSRVSRIWLDTTKSIQEAVRAPRSRRAEDLPAFTGTKVDVPGVGSIGRSSLGPASLDTGGNALGALVVAPNKHVIATTPNFACVPHPPWGCFWSFTDGIDVLDTGVVLPLTGTNTSNRFAATSLSRIQLALGDEPHDALVITATYDDDLQSNEGLGSHAESMLMRILGGGSTLFGASETRWGNVEGFRFDSAGYMPRSPFASLSSRSVLLEDFPLPPPTLSVDDGTTPFNIVRKPDADGEFRLKGIRVSLRRPDITRVGQTIHVGSIQKSLFDYQSWIDDSPLTNAAPRATLVVRVFLAGSAKQSTVLSPGPVRAAVTGDTTQTVLIQPTMLSDEIYTLLLVADEDSGSRTIKVIRTCNDLPADGVLGAITEYPLGEAPATATADGDDILIDGLQLQPVAEMQFIYADVVVCGKGSENPDLTSPPFELSLAEKQRSLTSEPLRVRTGAIDCSQGCPTDFPCVDGFCCSTPCDGACEACSVAAGATENGVCGLAAAGRLCRPTPEGCVVAPWCDGSRTDCPADPATLEARNLRDDNCNGEVDESCTPVDPVVCQSNPALCPPVDLSLDFEVAYDQYTSDVTYSPERGTTSGQTGTLPAQFDVTPDGAATYFMPIVVPPGRAGMQPTLGFDYNSDRGNGPLGVGWALGGLSEIRRCPKTYVRDQEIAEVQLDASDALCLDGVRLVSATLIGYSCPDGGFAYLPERDPFTKVCAYNWTSQQGSYFVAWTKDGRRLEYGRTGVSTADFDRGGGVFVSMAWGLSRVEDRRGNYMTVDYANPATMSGTVFPNSALMKRWARPAAVHSKMLSPSKIQYAGYAGPAGPPLAPQRSVELDYGGTSETRADVIKGYFKGQELVQSQLLRRVTTYGPGHHPVSTYILRYDEDAPELPGRSRLTSVQRCTGEGNSGDVCLPATRFEWSARHAIEFAPLASWLPSVPSPFELSVPYRFGAFLAELDGDGLSELAVFAAASDGGSWIVNGLGSSPPTASSTTASYLPVKYPIDLGSDGLTDFIETSTYSPYVGTPYLQASAGNLSEAWASPALAGPPFSDEWCGVTDVVAGCLPMAFPGDFDGDGTEDVLLLFRDSAGLPSLYSMNLRAGSTLTDTGLGWDPSVNIWGESFYYDIASVLDVDGDGKDELVYAVIDGTSSRIVIVDFADDVWSQSSYSITNPESGATTLKSWKWIDANGDGLKDVVIHALHGTDVYSLTETTYLFVNTGASLVPNARVLSTTGERFEACPGPSAFLVDILLGAAVAADFDGDGAEELVAPYPDADPRYGHFAGYRFDVADKTVSCDNYVGGGYYARPAEGTGHTAIPPIVQVGHVSTDVFPDLVVGDYVGWSVKLATGGPSDRIVSIRTGINPPPDIGQTAVAPSIEIAYGATTDGQVYTAGNDASDLAKCAANDVVCTTPNVAVVSHVVNRDANPIVSRSYSYEQARFHKRGRGWLGFGRVQTADALPETGLSVTTTTSYDLLTLDYSVYDFPYKGIPKTIKTITPISGSQASIVDKVDVVAAPPYRLSSRQGTPYYVYARGTQHRRWQGTEGDEAKWYLLESIDTVRDAFGNVLSETVNSKTAVASEDSVPGFSSVTWLRRLLAAESAGTTSVTTQAFNTNTTTWVVNQLNSRTVTSQSSLCTASKVPPAEPFTPDWTEQGSACAVGGLEHKTATFTYYGDGLLWTETQERDDPSEDLTTTYTYNDSAARTLLRVSEKGVADVDGTEQTRETSYTLDPLEYEFVLTETNAALQTQTTIVDRDFGAPVFAQDANGIVSRRVLDRFGQVVEEGRSGGDIVSTTRWTTLGASTGDQLNWIETASSTGAQRMEGYDRTGRLTRRLVVAPDGTQIAEDRVYDGDGRLKFVSDPYRSLSSDPPPPTGWPYGHCGSIRAYDGLGRELTTQRCLEEPDADGKRVGTTSYTYDRLVVTITDPRKHTTTSIANAAGQVIATIDPTTAVTRYVFGAFGSVMYAVDDKKNAVWTRVDGWGHKVAMQDPDLGPSSARYNAFGELIWTRDGAGREVTNTTDVLGRVVHRHDADGDTSWNWDTASGAGVGMLASSAGPDGQGASHVYDAFGRLKTRTVNRTVTSLGGAVALDFTTDYDFVGRIRKIAYPSQLGAFAVEYDYGPTGLLKSVRDVTAASPGTTLWQATSFDARLRVLAESFANGVQTTRAFYPETGRLKSIWTEAVDPARGVEVLAQNLSYRYDSAGNLWRRTDLNRPDASSGRNQEYGYDSMNRLGDVFNCDDSWTHVGTALGVDYDSIGNVTAKQGVGAYAYNGQWPHAVTLAGTTALEYYDNGNLKKRGELEIQKYTTFNKPTQVMPTAGAPLTEYRYDAEGNRAVKEAPEETTVYADGLYEIHRAAGGGTWAGYYVSINGRPAVLKVKDDVGGAVTFYLHGDNLGSVDLVTDDLGQAVDPRHYDAFGALEQANANVLKYVRLGFTGHEEEQDLGLVNMGGRLYDPILARFTSPDPFVQSPFFSQSWNRYSYGFNNPLMFVDPTGYWSLTQTFGVIQTVFSCYQVALGIVIVAGTCAETAGLGCAAGIAMIALGVDAMAHGAATVANDRPYMTWAQRGLLEVGTATVGEENAYAFSLVSYMLLQTGVGFAAGGGFSGGASVGGQVAVGPGGVGILGLDYVAGAIGVSGGQAGAAVGAITSGASFMSGSYPGRQPTIGDAKRAYAQNTDFRDYFHRHYKAQEGIGGGGRDNPDMSDEELLEAYEEWLAAGRPKR